MLYYYKIPKSLEPLFRFSNFPSLLPIIFPLCLPVVFFLSLNSHGHLLVVLCREMRWWEVLMCGAVGWNCVVKWCCAVWCCKLKLCREVLLYFVVLWAEIVPWRKMLCNFVSDINFTMHILFLFLGCWVGFIFPQIVQLLVVEMEVDWRPIW